MSRAYSLEAGLLGDDVLMGMGVEDVVSEAGGRRIVTPGVEVVLGGDGVLRVAQRIGAARKVFSLALDGHLAPWRVGELRGFWCVLEGNGLWIRVQGDGVVVFGADQNMTLGFEGRFKAAYHREARGNRLVLDEDGGVGFFGIPSRATTWEEHDAGWRVGCHLARWDELWVSVCPPRAENPVRAEQSISHDILYYLMKDDEMTERYPSKESLEDIAKHCQILALHEEIWKDAPMWVEDPPGGGYEHPKPWETDRHTPYDGEAFARMLEDAHALGLAVVVYCSPYYCSAPDLLGEMERVLKDYMVDGLYFDGWSYMREDFRPPYAFMRQARALLGDRILYMHSSGEPYGHAGVYPPFVFSYADFCLRGESGRSDLDQDDFLRYTVSGHNISNAVGMWCYYGSTGESGYQFVVPTTDHINAAKRNHVRLWRQSQMWQRFPKDLTRFDAEYYED